MSSPYNPFDNSQNRLTPEPRDDMKRLERSMTDKRIAGVCGGIARYLNVDPTLIRVIAILLTLVGIFPALLAYVVAWVVMPPEF